MRGTGRSGPRRPDRGDGGERRDSRSDRKRRSEPVGRTDRGTLRQTDRKREPELGGRTDKGARSEGSQDRLSPRLGGTRTGKPPARGGSGEGNARSAGGAAAGLKMGRIKGEWMEIRLPDTLAGAPMQAVLKQLPLPPKLASKLVHGRGLLLQGPVLRLHLFPRERLDFPPDWMELNILYEDEFTLVVNKPSGIEVHPSEQGQRRTLAHGVAAYYEMSGQTLRVRHIHRIDKETTGPVLYAKNEFAHYQYDKAMREKKIERIYLALAEGVIPQDKGTIDKPIGQDRHHSTRRRVSETGDPAVTHYQVVERFGDHTLVRLRLETGRTHQIRVHLAAIGHPLAGDGMYGGTRKIMSRQALHGEQLIWQHPWTGERQQVRAPLPDDFTQALEKLRKR
ncbi:RluA family pseudouridine synthase [Cohnella sp. CFH 77786]|uniref:RluA family pseudouridine synthase n=1 Tax=Cohnella sp. CFH 77786 TaxID=2662265 RepID=UPI002104CC9F|nr:RluA family pseudouridine synthase [Cohnella sp. CFH 77786]